MNNLTYSVGVSWFFNSSSMKWFCLAEESNEWLVSVTTVIDCNYILSFLYYNTTVASNSPTFVCSRMNLSKMKNISDFIKNKHLTALILSPIFFHLSHHFLLSFLFHLEFILYHFSFATNFSIDFTFSYYRGNMKYDRWLCWYPSFHHPFDFSKAQLKVFTWNKYERAWQKRHRMNKED